MYSPSANNIGMDLNVPTVRMVNRDAATLVVGDVVVMSTAHTGVVYPPTTRTQEPFSPLASVVKAGSAPFTPGFIGTVARLGPMDGRTNDTVDVVFGGLATAKVAAVGTNVVLGTQLSLSSTTGQLTNDATGRIVALSLGSVTAGQTGNIDVILDGEIAADTATLGTFATLAVTGNSSIPTITSATSFTNTTASTSTTTGAIVVAGGVGVAGSINVGGDSRFVSTGAITIPSGTIAQRPGTPVAGMIRNNTTSSRLEYYNGTAWQTFQPETLTVEYLVIGGGGGGWGGGGGAGGYRCSVSGESSGGGASAESALNLVSGVSYTVTVGAGGASQAIGTNSVFGSVTSTRGGHGAQYGTTSIATRSGGSGGGGAVSGVSVGVPGTGTANEGYDGGTQVDTTAGAGGGGAGAIGSAGTVGNGGNGGVGVASSINGTSTFRAGGGGGGGSVSGGTGGNGGGAPGGNNTPANASANTGGGGGGGFSQPGSAGGSGIVIVRYLGAQRATGGTVTSSGGYTIHTFTTSGTFALVA